MNFYTPQNYFVELKAEWDNFRQGAYPAFVTQKKTIDVPDNIPVFSYHNIDAVEFERNLKYLKHNGYETVTCDEYLDRAGKPNQGRAVMLTFDDGFASVWKVAHPLLRKYGMKAVAFVLPGETHDAETAREQTTGGENEEPLCTWPELLAMQDVIDIQSHSLYHWIMFTSREVACIFTEDIKRKWLKKDLPVIRIDGEDNPERDYPLGTKFYDMDARLSDTKRIFAPEETGDGFMEESDEAQAEAIRLCFEESKKILEDKLPGHTVSHFCFPFTIGAGKAIRAGIEAGYRAMYWGVSAPEYVKEFPEVSHVTRVKSDYIYRLPGEGRQSIFKIVAGKVLRRLI